MRCTLGCMFCVYSDNGKQVKMQKHWIVDNIQPKLEFNESQAHTYQFNSLVPYNFVRWHFFLSSTRLAYAHLRSGHITPTRTQSIEIITFVLRVIILFAGTDSLLWYSHLSALTSFATKYSLIEENYTAKCNIRRYWTTLRDDIGYTFRGVWLAFFCCIHCWSTPVTPADHTIQRAKSDEPNSNNTSTNTWHSKHSMVSFAN